eukprot:UN02668
MILSWALMFGLLFNSAGVYSYEPRKRQMSAITLDEIKQRPISVIEYKSKLEQNIINENMFLNTKYLDDTKRGSGSRRLLNIPDGWHEQCVYWINAMRGREGLPVLRRWTEFESCSDEMAEYDFTNYVNGNGPHKSLADNVGCDFTNQGGIAQNACPLWENDPESYKWCTIAMWEEKEYPGIDPNDLTCQGEFRSECGHYYAMRGGGDTDLASGNSIYNKCDRVACGFLYR